MWHMTPFHVALAVNEVNIHIGFLLPKTDLNNKNTKPKKRKLYKYKKMFMALIINKVV